jgi:hypothetical protein
VLNGVTDEVYKLKPARSEQAKRIVANYQGLSFAFATIFPSSQVATPTLANMYHTTIVILALLVVFVDWQWLRWVVIPVDP